MVPFLQQIMWFSAFATCVPAFVMFYFQVRVILAWLKWARAPFGQKYYWRVCSIRAFIADVPRVRTLYWHMFLAWLIFVLLITLECAVWIPVILHYSRH